METRMDLALNWSTNGRERERERKRGRERERNYYNLPVSQLIHATMTVQSV
jgi:hypothetical protein